MLSRLEINTQWDWLIFGDGSGSTFDRGAGWAAISIERETLEERTWRGGVNYGTVNMAEIMAYMAPLTYINDRQQKKAKENTELGLVRVVIVTDSQYVQLVGNGTVRGTSNAGLWAVINAIKRDGVVVNFIHLRRDIEELNRRCDKIARSSRILVESAIERTSD